MTLLAPLLCLVLGGSPQEGARPDAPASGLTARLRLVEPYVWHGRAAGVSFSISRCGRPDHSSTSPDVELIPPRRP